MPDDWMDDSGESGTGSGHVFVGIGCSEDGFHTYGPFTLPDPNQPYVFDVEFEAETLRFDVTDSSGGNVGVVEIAVYGEPAAG
jgi:hypothetical protein